MDGSVREFAVSTRGYDFDHQLWLDESTGAYRFGVSTDSRPDGFASVFDGVRAATRTQRQGPSLVRYEGSPAVVARLAGSLSVTAAFAFVRGEALPPNVSVTESTASPPPGSGDVFALPTGTERRIVRQVPITTGAVGRGYWLGDEWDGLPPDFAAVSEAGDLVAVLVVYPGICVITSAVRGGEELLGESATLAGGAAAVVAHARTQPDGQFGTRWRDANGSIHPLGHFGNDLTIAGVGERAIEATVGAAHIIITGSHVNDDSIPTTLQALRRI